MFSIVGNKPLSLVEQKKLQWAREREEMARLCAPWGNRPGNPPLKRNYDRASLRSQYSLSDASNCYHSQYQRGNSLPPIYKSDYTPHLHSINSANDGYYDRGGETSGYASDVGGPPPIVQVEGQTRVAGDWSNNNTQWPVNNNNRWSNNGGQWVIETEPDNKQWHANSESQQPNVEVNVAPPYNNVDLSTWQQQQQQDGGRQQQKLYSRDGDGGNEASMVGRRYSSGDMRQQSSFGVVRPPQCGTPDSVMSERPRWGDRGVGVGHLWEPNEIGTERANGFPKVVDRGAPPGWLQRGLRRDSEVLLISSNQSSEKESGEDTESNIGSRYCCDCENSACYRTYLRGQNTPLDAMVLAERELKRQRALEHQHAIREQLEERERHREEERVRRIQEEREEEERVERERQEERERVLAEEKRAKEKRDREQRKIDAIKQAMDEAERAAKLEKQKLKMAKLQRNQNRAVENNKGIDDAVRSNRKFEVHCESPIIEDAVSQTGVEVIKPHSPKKEIASVQPSPRIQIVTPDPQSISKTVHQKSINETPRQAELITADGLALVLQTASLDSNLSNVQFALLMTPQMPSSTNTLPVAIPLSARSNVGTDLSSRNQNSLVESRLMTSRNCSTSTENPTVAPLSARNNPIITENRILTPTKYRQRNVRDNSTQTDPIEFVMDGKPRQRDCRYGSLDRQRYERSRRERRMRSEERTSLEERPKWGVNRPPKQYLTQSEKDPLYQKKKMRQKLREMKVYEDKNYSSDESRSSSPSSRNYKKVVRNHWQSNEKMYMRNVNVYQTEIMPLESDSKGRLVVGQKNFSRRQSISEKFLVAKQKNNMLKSVENNKLFDNKVYSSRSENVISVDSRKSKLNRQNEETKIYKTEIEEVEQWNDSGSDVLNQLTSLKRGLVLKQKQWELSPKRSVSPPKAADMDIDVI